MVGLAGCAAYPLPTAVRGQSPSPTPELKPITKDLAKQALSLAEKPELTAADFIDQPLADVKVEGNSTIPEIAILHEVESKPGRPVSPSVIKEDVANLIAKNWFFRVNPVFRATDAGPVLVFQVVEKPILLSDAQFVGNKKIKTEALLNLTGLKRGVAYDVATNKEAEQRIKDHYREKGYNFADVKLTKGDKSDEREVVFEIHEGHKVRVHRIYFDGNRAFSSAILKTKLATKTIWGIPGTLLAIGGNYDPEKIKNDADGIVRYYHSLGYFDAQVDVEETYRKDKSEVYVHYHIKEGQRFKVRNIEFNGNKVLSTEQLRPRAELKESDYYNERLLQKDVQTMRDKYDDLGRLFAKVEPVPRFLEETGWVDLVYEIDEDMPRRIGSIDVHIQGDHPHSTETLVINQINRWIKPGELARMRDIQGAQTSLRGSQYWDKQQAPPVVNVEPSEGKEYLPPRLLARGQDGFDRVAPAFDPSVNPFAEFEGRITTARLPDDAAASADEPEGRARVERASFSTELPDDEAAPARVRSPGYNIDPAAIFDAPGGQDDIVFRGQSIDRQGLPMPQDYLQTDSPQGDPFGDALRNPSTPGFVDVDIDVTEARTGRLMFGVGVNSNAGLVGNIVLQEDNFDILPRRRAGPTSSTARPGAVAARASVSNSSRARRSAAAW
ncbi:MAG: POTRA domain-containing protein [Planctomycetaceae bacterium]